MRIFNDWMTPGAIVLGIVAAAVIVSYAYGKSRQRSVSATAHFMAESQSYLNMTKAMEALSRSITVMSIAWAQAMEHIVAGEFFSAARVILDKRDSIPELYLDRIIRSIHTLARKASSNDAQRIAAAHPGVLR